MNPLQHLLQLSAEEKERLGVVHTPAEIRQQPAIWKQALGMLREHQPELRRFLDPGGGKKQSPGTLLLAGAGSSEFVGNAVAPLLRRRLQRQVLSAPTTSLVTHAENWLIPDGDCILVSFARSGNSPESVAALHSVRRVQPGVRHLVITCNPEGELARVAGSDPQAYCLQLPEATNDRSLVMTSSFSTMALVAMGLGFLAELPRFEEIGESLAAAGERVFAQSAGLLEEFARLPFRRVCYLGSGCLAGLMQECSLKMQEMTDGRIVAQSTSYLGLRHGPQVFVSQDCAVVASLSGAERVRRYELDLLRELQEKRQGCAILAICAGSREEARDLATHVVQLGMKPDSAPDCFRVVSDVLVGQLLGTFKSLDLGLRPDAPSASGVINRVVEGVVIYG